MHRQRRLRAPGSASGGSGGVEWEAMHVPARTTAFSLVELMIIVGLIGILAAIAVPQFTGASDDARQAQLRSNLRLLRQQIDLYQEQHGQGPHLDEDGRLSLWQFVPRMLNRTDASGALDPEGRYGPYLLKWPANPFVEGSGASSIRYGWQDAPPRDGTFGWYYSIPSCLISANSRKGAEDMDPGGAGATTPILELPPASRAR